MTTELKRVAHYVWEPEVEAHDIPENEIMFLNGMGIDHTKQPVVLTKKQAKLYNLFLGLDTRKQKTETKEKEVATT